MVIDVHTMFPYSVHVESGFDRFNNLRALAYGRKTAIVTDANVAPLYGDCLDPYLVGREVVKIVIEAGEAHKSPREYLMILNELARRGFTRNDTVIALGGGVVGDLAGFVASTYMRGVRFINVPTSLLAMVDSAVGGKTAINIDYGKNLCGTFYQPVQVLENIDFLSTLPAREMMCGWGEIIKYAFLSNAISLDELRGDVTPQLIAKCVQIKVDVVSRDEREAGARRLLNLGHTIGHAIERLSGFALSHGECVVKGIAAILEMSKRYYKLSDETYARALAIISSKGHDLTNPFGKEEIMAELTRDKKSDHDGVSMVLIDEDLSARVVHLGYKQIEGLL